MSTRNQFHFLPRGNRGHFNLLRLRGLNHNLQQRYRQRRSIITSRYAGHVQFTSVRRHNILNRHTVDTFTASNKGRSRLVTNRCVISTANRTSFGRHDTNQYCKHVSNRVHKGKVNYFSVSLHCLTRRVLGVTYPEQTYHECQRVDRLGINNRGGIAPSGQTNNRRRQLNLRRNRCNFGPGRRYRSRTRHDDRSTRNVHRTPSPR